MSGEILLSNLDEVAGFVAAFHKTGCIAWFTVRYDHGNWVIKFEAV
mgnify:FL=1